MYAKCVKSQREAGRKRRAPGEICLVNQNILGERRQSESDPSRIHQTNTQNEITEPCASGHVRVLVRHLIPHAIRHRCHPASGRPNTKQQSATFQLTFRVTGVAPQEVATPPTGAQTTEGAVRLPLRDGRRSNNASIAGQKGKKKGNSKQRNDKRNFITSVRTCEGSQSRDYSAPPPLWHFSFAGASTSLRSKFVSMNRTIRVNYFLDSAASSDADGASFISIVGQTRSTFS